MIIAFWNCTLGKGSNKFKVDAFVRWVAAASPQLLLLEEVSQDILIGNPPPIESTLPAYKLLGFVNTLNVNDKKTTKCIVSLAPPREIENFKFQARLLALPGLDQKRGLLKVTSTGTDLQSEIWTIHANASKSGGETAVKAVVNYIAGAKNGIVGGDFNCQIATVRADGLNPANPHSWQGNDLTFTQWNHLASGPINPLLLPNFHLSAANAQRYAATLLKPNLGPIDYLAHGASIGVQPLNNCLNEAAWWEILCYFDHCPILYQIDE